MPATTWSVTLDPVWITWAERGETDAKDGFAG